MSVSVYEYIRNSACIGTSLDSYFFLSHSVLMCFPVSAILLLIVCVYVRLLIRVFVCFLFFPLSFSEGFLLSYNDWDRLYVYTYVSWSALVSLCLFLCVSQHPGILSVICMYMNKCNQLNPRLSLIYFIFCVYTYVSWFVFLSLPLSLNVCTSLRLYYYSV